LSGTATFTDCSLKNNKALNRGGAIGMGFGALTLTKASYLGV
jgi:predicted outer membrane repeat protein